MGVPHLHNLKQHLFARLETGVSRWIVGMAGVPGAGKSTLASRLTEEVNQAARSEVMIALGMDGFHLSKAQLRQRPDAEIAFSRRGAFWTFDASAMAERLQKIKSAKGKEIVGWPEFQHEIGDSVENGVMVSPVTRLILVEGLYLLHNRDGWEKVTECLDERWYLDTPLETAMQRLSLRHREVWNLSLEGAEVRIATNDRLNAEVVLKSRDNADWCVSVE